MFGFGKSKDKDRMKQAIKSIVELLNVQISLAVSFAEREEFNRRFIDEFSRGYILGFCDGLLQQYGYTDDSDAFTLITAIHVELYGKDHAGEILNQSLNDQSEPKFSDAQVVGGQEAFGFANHNSPPMGLFEYLSSGKYSGT